MCGIAGFCDFEEAFLKDTEGWTQVLVAMRTAILHRGHNQTGEYLRHNVGLAHTRLSIRDLAGGAQPMVRRRGAWEYAIVYNGEIYNAEELKQDLLSRGYRFETTCDTEVILCGYMEYGIEVAKKLNGIFAFAIWDERQETLFLCRDRMGVKPLFYTVEGNTLVFGSEPKALFAHPRIRPQADLDSFREIFGVGPARTPGCGVFRGVHEVKPGCILSYSRTQMRAYPYWSLEAKPHTDSYEQTVEKVPGCCGIRSNGSWYPTYRCAAFCLAVSIPLLLPLWLPVSWERRAKSSTPFLSTSPTMIPVFSPTPFSLPGTDPMWTGCWLSILFTTPIWSVMKAPWPTCWRMR